MEEEQTINWEEGQKLRHGIFKREKFFKRCVVIVSYLNPSGEAKNFIVKNKYVVF